MWRKWTYKGCTVLPIQANREWTSHPYPTDFGFGIRYRYWKIIFPDGSWIFIRNKKECREYIDKVVDKHQKVKV